MIPAEWLPVGCIIAPLTVGVVLIPLGFYTSRRFQGLFAIGTSAFTLFLTFLLLQVTLEGTIVIHKMAGWKPPFGILLVVDVFNGFIAFIIAFLVLFATVYSIEYMKHDIGLSYYYALLMLLLSGMVGVVLTGDIFNLFVFLELTSISAYGLVAFRSMEMEPLEAGFKYLVMGATATSLVLFGIALLYGAVGTVNYADIAYRLKNGGLLVGVKGNLVLPLSLIFIMGGFGIKAAVFPLHTWLPDAHPAAPSPVSAILSGVVIKVGVYALCRILFLVFQPAHINWVFLISMVSFFTMTVGNFMALLQDDIKRMLAFSSIAQIGYILVGVAAANQLGISGVLLHTFNHSIMKGLAFLCAGAFLHQVGTRKLDELAGVGSKMPLTTMALTIAFLGLIGVPPLNGFVSKFILFTAGIESGLIWLVVAGIINSAISAGYYLRFINVLIRMEASEKVMDVKEAPAIMTIPILILAGLIVLFGIWPQPILDVSEKAAFSLFNIDKYVTAVLGG